MWEMGCMELCDGRKQKRKLTRSIIRGQFSIFMLFYTVPST